jgi:HlyD family secretion protein
MLPESYADLIDTTSSNIYPFRPGMSATIDILTETREDVISVPISAVTTRVKGEGKTENKQDDDESEFVEPEERLEVVYVMKDGIVRQVEVKTGIQDNTSIEILEGISAGDEVVVAPYNAISNTLKDSMTVKVVTEEELFKGE